METTLCSGVRPYKEFVPPPPMKRTMSHLSESEKLSIINVYKYVTDSWPVDKYRSKKEMKEKTAYIMGISLATVYRVLKQYVDTGTVKPALKRLYLNKDKVNHSNNVTGSNLGNVEEGASSKNQTVDYAQIEQCSNCKESINGSVYTCVQCAYVMCASCDVEGAHAHHYVLRAPLGRTREEVQTVKTEVTEVLAPILEHFNDVLPDVAKASTSQVHTEVIVKEELDIEENDPLEQLEMRQNGVAATDVGCAGDAQRAGAPVAGTSQLQAWPFETKFVETFIKKEIDPDEEENQPSLTPHTVNIKSEPVEYEVNIKQEAIVPRKRKRKENGQDSDDLDDSIYSE